MVIVPGTGQVLDVQYVRERYFPVKAAAELFVLIEQGVTYAGTYDTAAANCYFIHKSQILSA